MQVHAYTGRKCCIFFFHKGATVVVWCLHVILLRSVCFVAYTHTVPDNDSMSVFGIYCNILSMLIGNSIISYLTGVFTYKPDFKWQSDNADIIAQRAGCKTCRVHNSPVRRLARRNTWAVCWRIWVGLVELREGCCSICVEVSHFWCLLISSWTVLCW